MITTDDRTDTLKQLEDYFDRYLVLNSASCAFCGGSHKRSECPWTKNSAVESANATERINIKTGE